MKFTPKRIIEQTISKFKKTHFTKTRITIFASFILIALMSSAAFSSNIGIGSLKDLLFTTQSINPSTSIVFSLMKSKASSTTQPIFSSATSNPIDEVAFVTTDRTDYNPGDTVVITGSGFDAFENVSLVIQRNEVEAATYQVSADENGNIINRDFVIGEDDLGASFVLTATGADSGRIASSNFTDGTMSYTPVTQTYINAGAIESSASSQIISFSQSVIGASGNPNTFTVIPTITRQSVVDNSINYSALPVSYGVSVSPTSLSYCASSGRPSNTQQWQVSITVPANAVPAGGTILRYAVNVKATQSSPASPQHLAGAGTNILIEIKAPTPTDTTAPTTTLTSGTYVNNAWTNQNVTVNLSSADNVGGVGMQNLSYTVTGPSGPPVTTVVSGSPFTASIPVSLEGNTTISYFGKDIANNTESTKFFYVNIDKTKPVITLTGADITLTHGTTFTDPGFSASDNRAPTDLASNVVVTGAVNTNVVGDYTLNYNVSDTAGNAADQKTRTVHVIKANQTINFDGGTPASKTFGDPAFNVTATGGDSGNLVTYAAGAGSTCNVTDNNDGTAQVSDLAAGSCVIVASQAGNDNYNAAPDEEHTITVDKAEGSVSINNIPNNAVYGGSFTPAFTSLGDGATSAASQTPATCTVSGGIVSYVGAGQCQLKASVAEGTNHNAAEGETQSFDIAKANATIDVQGYSDTYDGAEHGASGTATGVSNEDLSSLLDLGARYTDVPGGPADWSFAGNDNYNSANGSVSVTINKADADCSVSGFTGTYDGDAHGAGGSCTGVGGATDILSGLALGSTFTNVPGGAAEWSFSGGTNYNDDSGSVDITISKADSTTVLTCPANATYTGSPIEICSANVTGAGGLDESVSVVYADNTNAGSATASATYAGDDNHNGSADNGGFIIDKADTTTVLTCLPNATYTGSPIEICSANVTGAGGLDESVSVVYADNTNAGSATASATYPGDDNHNGSADNGGFTIDKASSSTVVTCPTNETYTGLALEPCSANVTGIGGLDEPVSVVYADNTNAGSATASAAYAGDDNHNGSSGDSGFTIDKAGSSTVVTCPTNETYTGLALEPCSANVTGIGGLDEPVSVVYTDNTNAGSATASATYAESANHNGSSDSGGFTIVKADSSTVVTCPVSQTYTGSAIEPCSVAVTGEGLNLTPDPIYSNNIIVGTASASYSFAGDANHNGSSDSKNFEIEKAPTTTIVTFEAGPYVYRGTPFTATAQVTGAGALNSPVAVVLSGNCTNVTVADGCTATATYAESANHLGSTGSKSITITKKTATLTADNRTKIFAEPVTFAGTEFTTSGFINGDSVSSVTLTSTGAPAGAGVGSYDIIPSAAVGTGVQNYSITYVKGTLKVIYATGGLCNGSPGHQILQPIDSDGSSVFKQKSTVPAKFRVCDFNGVSISSPNLVTGFNLVQVFTGTIAASVTEEVVSTTPDTTFRWSASDLQWIFNINTKNLQANKTYVYLVSLNDGSNITFRFGLK